ncbi:MAG: acylphosphatase [Archangiaceae bacterium]|nr:acylphosphatase [Archangiaceae bacterium]
MGVAGADHTRIHLVIRGQVQGVSYRASARNEALRLKLTGWVRNCPNGDVEAVAEGDARGLQQFVAWCRRGPEEARVEGVTEQPGPATFEFSTFAVTR